MRILVADDHPLMVEGIAALLSPESDLELVARCADGAEALAAVITHRPDTLVLDLHMPTMGGLQVLTELRDLDADLNVVLLAGDLTGPEALQAVRLGVRGIVLKSEEPHRLIECLRRVEAGERWIDPSAFGALLDTALEREARSERIRGLLTDRELDVIGLVAEGLSNKGIADGLGIGTGTVKTHLYNIFQKLDVANRTELTVLAGEHGLVS